MLKNSNLRKLFLADICSQMGMGLTFISLNWTILEATHSSQAVGLGISIGILSSILGSILSGTISDAFNRNMLIKLILGIQALVLMVLLVILWSHSPIQIVYWYLLAFINGLTYSLYCPSIKSLLKEFLSTQTIFKNYALFETSVQINHCITSLICGFILHYLQMSGIIIFNILLSLIAIIIFFKVDAKTQITKTEKKPVVSYMQEFVKGFKHLIKNPIMFGMIFLLLLPQSVPTSVNVILPSYVSMKLNADTITFGHVYLCISLGGILAGLMMYRSNNPLRPIKQALNIYPFLGLSAFILLFLSSNTSIYWGYLAFIGLGTVQTSLKVALNTYILENIDANYIGRVFSWVLLISIIFQLGLSKLVAYQLDNDLPLAGFLSLFAYVVVILSLYHLYQYRTKSINTVPSAQ